jgi:tetratricopeptide (TPR) repeat protein
MNPWCRHAVRIVVLLGFAAPVAATPLPFTTDDPSVASLWQEGERLEHGGHYLESAKQYEQVAEKLPGESHVDWRVARNYYMQAKSLPFSEPERRKEFFLLTQEWAARGIAANDRCAECYLYKFVGMSRVATTNGILSSASNAKPMAALLDRAEELQPTHVDGALNSELANLYYAAGVFYRSVPESSMISWAIGVKGDRERAIRYLRRANEISGGRVDYHIELGTALLCAGTDDEDSARIAEGVTVLSKIPALADFQPSDEIDRRAAPMLIQQPEKACDFSREEFAAQPS